jgi:hypothetical protein
MANHPDFDKLRGQNLADFVRGLPEGQRHKGFFWAANAAIEDGLPPAEVDKVAQAGVSAGLDEKYVNRTIAQAKEDHEV